MRNNVGGQDLWVINEYLGAEKKERLRRLRQLRKKRKISHRPTKNQTAASTPLYSTVYKKCQFLEYTVLQIVCTVPEYVSTTGNHENTNMKKSNESNASNQSTTQSLSINPRDQRNLTVSEGIMNYGLAVIRRF